MVSFYAKVLGATNQAPSLLAKLEGVFESLNDAELLTALQGKIHRGCQGYPVKALWRSYVAGYVLNIPTVALLVRRLRHDAPLRNLCGLPAAPSEATYSRFVARLTEHSALVSAAMETGVAQLGASLPDFGKTVAVDSSDITAYSQSRKPSDPDARWGKKRDKHGHDKWWFGYKVHMVADATYELPIHVDVTPANVSDSTTIIHLLGKVKTKPSFVLADAGYDAIDNYRWIVQTLGAVPIIKLNRRGKGARTGAAHHGKAELWASHYREHIAVPRGSSEWDALYSHRVSLERLWSRAKEFRRLASVHHRGLSKVTLHCYLSTLTIVASALSMLYSAQSEALRRVA